MGAVLPPDPLRVDEPDERLVYQCSGLQGVSLPFAAHVAAGEPAKLAFD